MSQLQTIAGTVTVGSWSPVALAEELGVDSVDVTHYTAAAGASDDEVEIGGASVIDDVQCVLITAASYPETVPGMPDLGYKVNTNLKTEIPMSMFHLYSQHMSKALDVAGLLFDSIFVSNANAADIDMIIVVGRNNV